jgi:hypothetical protein
MEGVQQSKNLKTAAMPVPPCRTFLGFWELDDEHWDMDRVLGWEDRRSAMGLSEAS